MNDETTAGQLKGKIPQESIVDDAQFRNALSAWYRAKSGASRPQKVERDFAALIAAIDNFRAPMVADPAGVAVQRLRELAAGRITGEIPVFEYSIAADRIAELESALAATVKGVPSEALEVGPFTLEQRMPPKDTQVLIYWPCSDGTFGCAVDEWSDLYEDPIGTGGPTICVGEGWMRHDADVVYWAPIPVVSFAAPLAGTTGGGE
jgi:hypothetical protein